MRALVTVLRALLGVFALIYVVLGIAIGSVLVEGLPPGGWGAPAWVWLIPVGFWLAVIALRFSGPTPEVRERITIVVLALPLSFALGVLFGTAPEFWAQTLRPLARRSAASSPGSA